MGRKFIIWGASFKGKILLNLLGKERVIYFIDNDSNKIGTKYYGKPVLDFASHCRNDNKYFIIISMTDNMKEVEQKLIDYSIYNYFIFSPYQSDLHLFMDQSVNLIQYDVKKSNAIYGINLYSLLFYDYLKQNGCNELFLVPTKNERDSLLLKQMKQYFPDLNILNLYEIEDKIDKLFVTTIINKDQLKSKNYEIEEILNLSKRIYNPEINKFKGIHNEKRCFIVCTGTSLKYEDLDMLYEHNELCISMNQIYTGFNKTKWRPNYFICEDILHIETYGHEFENIDIEHKFVADSYLPFWKEKHNNIYKFHLYPCYESSAVPEFSDDFSRIVYTGGSVTYTCIQLAVYLGFKKIYLIGVDFNYSVNREENHFTKEYDNRITSPWMYNINAVLLAYEKARIISEERGINIYNATRGGALEVFERVNFDDLFGKFKEII